MKASENYSTKATAYFSGIRRRFVDDLPANPSARLLEIGCGDGSTSAYALATAKCGWCCGVELCEGPAAQATNKLNTVITGDIEKLELPLAPESVDVLLLSEVLEHLINPWKVLRKLRPLIKPGGLVRAGSPNAAHYRVIWMLLRGQWRYDEAGIMDTTHLRWFTPKSYALLFNSCGFCVDSVSPARPLGIRGRLVNALTLGRLRHLLHPQIFLRAHCPRPIIGTPTQWALP